MGDDVNTLTSIALDDEKAERVRLSHARAIQEAQQRPGFGMVVIKDVVLANNVRTPVPHGLGRAPSWIKESCIRGSVTIGAVVEFRDGVDRASRVEIAASGFGATITVDLLVVP